MASLSSCSTIDTCSTALEGRQCDDQQSELSKPVECLPQALPPDAAVGWRDKFRYVFGPNILMSFNSSVLSNALLNLSAAPRHGDPLVIRFSQEWDSHQGPAFQWYHQQNSRTFQTIQYRKEYEEPFCHEFVVLKLLDGWFCRVERMGDPLARIEALRTNGTTAHDLIQLHPPNYLSTLDNTSSVVMEITPPNEIDLIHVLAICYSIKQDEHARQYTLQRFNCYFFSWTIILLLARRTAQWERMPHHYTWDLMIPELSNTLTGLSSSNSPGELAFRITRLLTPNGQVPSSILFEELRPYLTTEDSRGGFSEGLAMFLWSSELRMPIENTLKQVVSAAAQTCARYRHVGQAILEEPHTQEHVELARDILSMQRRVAKFHPVRHGYAQRIPMSLAVDAHYMRTRMGTLKRIASTTGCRAHGTVQGALHGIRSCLTDGHDLFSSLRDMKKAKRGDCGLSILDRVNLLAKTGHICAGHIVQHMKTGAVRCEVEYFQLEEWATMGAAEVDRVISEFSLTCLLDFLESASDLDDIPGHVKAAVYAFLESREPECAVDYTRFRDMEHPSMVRLCSLWDKTWTNWIWSSTKTTLIDVISKSLIENEPQSLVVSSLTGQNNSYKITNTQLQSIIDKRIIQHSHRVEANRLGYAEWVQEDVRKAMDAAWMKYHQLMTI